VAIVAQLLNGQDTQALDPQVAIEHLAFQRAICKVEVEMAMYVANGNERENGQGEQVQEKRRRPF